MTNIVYELPLAQLRAECEAVTGVRMSQRRLCREAGLSPTVVCHAERDGRIGVRAAALCAEVLSRELGRTISWKDLMVENHVEVYRGEDL